MRIAYVINSVEGGGAASPVPSITRVIRDAGAELKVFVLARRDGRALPAMHDAGLSIAIREGRENDNLGALLWLNAELAQWRPTHIWTSLTRATLLGQLVGARRRLPVISWQHAAYLKPANLALLRATKNLSTLWIGDSHSVTALTAKRLAIPSEKITTWPIFAASPDAPQAKPWQHGETLRLGSLGRLHPVKGYDILIEAFCILEARGFRPTAPVEILIAGDGAERGALEAQAKSLSIFPVRFVGYAERARNFLASLHLYVQPSRSEGLCIAAHEAMQAGLGIVASAVGELPYSIEPGVTGAVAPPNDPQALAEALTSLIRHPEHLGAVGAQARIRVLERFGRGAFEARGRQIVERISAN